ncbi:MAG: AAA family ATPase [Clostridia bacterium]|nr:AAA family ATPase [Clostridia bacterium]
MASYKPETLKECITLIEQVSYVLDKIHRQGYLYMDIKPENVLVADGYQKQIQLFDFDSLLPMEDIKSKTSCKRISYSKGFAAIELRTSQIKHFGIHTDVYGVGALAFYLLFGRTPSAPDCEMDAEFDFSEIQYDCDKCDDKLFGALSDFFHNTLAVYHEDRYQSMNDVTECLREIERYADLTIPRIYSTKIASPQFFCGRDEELSEIDNFLKAPDCNCIFITGMGGIGKSTLIREYLRSRWERFDTILYVHYNESIEATISNDDNIEINTLKQDSKLKDGERYFDKKLRKIREIVRGTSSLLVIDNFTGDVDDDLRALLAADLKVILLSRQAPSYKSGREMKLSSISDTRALCRIFEHNLGRSMTEDEKGMFEQILQRVGRHTLVLELIAKQIANSHITVSRAASLTSTHGFSAIASEKVDYERDGSNKSDTIGNIIDALFEANALSAEKKTLMKVASLLGDDGMDINQFKEIMKLPTLDDLNELIKDGWLMISGDVISMHRVIQEAVRRWEWTAEYIKAAEEFLSYFFIEIRLESTKNNYPKFLQQCGCIARDYNSRNKWMSRLFDICIDRNGLVGKVFKERYLRITDESPADLKKLGALLVQSENILNQCKREPAIKARKVYPALLADTLINIPRYKEDYILTEAKDLLEANKSDFIISGFNELLNNDENENLVIIMRLYAIVALIHADNKRFDEADKWFEEARQFAERAHDDKVYALYYNLLGDYYDILLNGAYDTENKDEERILNKMFDTTEKTLYYSKQVVKFDDDHLYAKNLLAKAVLLMRSVRGTEKEVAALINEAKKIIWENTSLYADVRLHFYLVRAWYYALMCDDAESADEEIKHAWELADAIIPTDLQKIEDVIIPCANIFYELWHHDRAIDLLYEGTRLCAKRPNNDSYARVKKELCDHIWEVVLNEPELKVNPEIIRVIDAENAEIIDPKNRVIIPDDVRRMTENEAN